MPRRMLSLIAAAALLASTSGAALAQTATTSPKECDRLLKQIKNAGTQETASKFLSHAATLGCSFITQP